MENKIKLKRIVNAGRLQKVQDHFSEILKVPIRIFNVKGELITRPADTLNIWERLGDFYPRFIDECKEFFRFFRGDHSFGDSGRNDYCCELGLHIFSLGIKLPGDELAANAVVGPVILGPRPTAKKYQKKAKCLDVDVDKLGGVIADIKAFSFSGADSALSLLSDVFSCVFELDYHNFKLGRIMPLSKLKEAAHDIYVNKLCSALLDVSSNVIGGETASVMLINEKTNELYIKASKGIRKEIISRARQRIGEGLAGIAFQKRRPMVIGSKVEDEEIKSLLTRPKIKNSMIVPIKTTEKIFGVMNIATCRRSSKFNSANMSVISQLTSLAAKAMQDVVALA